MITDEENIKAECLNERNEILKNNQNPNSAEPDPTQEEKIKALEKEIKYLNETIEILEKKTLNAKSENWKLKMKILEIEENQDLINNMRNEIKELQKWNENFNADPGTSSPNPRGAGRKPKITPEQIAMIQMLRVQGKKLQEIQEETGISYGNIQKYCKLITNNKRAGS